MAALTALLAGLEKNAAAVRAQADVVKRWAICGLWRRLRGDYGANGASGALAGARGALVELQDVARLRLVVAAGERVEELVMGRGWFHGAGVGGADFTGVVAQLGLRCWIEDAMPVELDVVNGDGALAQDVCGGCAGGRGSREMRPRAWKFHGCGSTLKRSAHDAV